MRRTVLALMLVGLTGTLVAQAPIVRAPDSPIKRVLIGNSAITDITFGRAEPSQTQKHVTEMSGGVQFKVNGIVVIADGASVDVFGGEIRLRGDVRVKLQ